MNPGPVSIASVRIHDAPAFRPEPATGAPVFVIGGVNMDISGTPSAELRAGDSNPGHIGMAPGGVSKTAFKRKRGFLWAASAESSRRRIA